MRRIALTLCLFLFCIDAGIGHAEPRPLIAAASLPSADLGSVPGKVPARIGAQERNRDIFVASADKEGSATIVATGKFDMQRFGDQLHKLPADRCLVVDHQFGMDQDAHPWPSDLQLFSHLNARVMGAPIRPVAARLLQTKSNETAAEVEYQDAWVDPLTRGVRTFAKGKLQFARIGEYVGGVRVYAGKGAEDVNFLVVMGATKNQESIRAGRMQGMTAMSNEGRGASFQQCTFALLSLPIVKGDGATTTVRVPLVLGADEVRDDEQGNRTVPSVVPTGAPLTTGLPKTLELRVRELGVNLSTSWATRETDAVVSVTTTWLGRERRERQFVPVE
jgi:hypothetical protein